MGCLFCHKIETYPHGNNVEYVCGSCVQRFLFMGAETARRIYDECLAEKRTDQARGVGLLYGFKT